MIELNGKPFSSMQQSYGGDTLNTATYLARIIGSDSVEISYITVIGADQISQKIKQYWQDDGINTQYVLTDSDRLLGIYLIQLDEFGERTFLNWRQNSAARYLLQHKAYPKIADYLNGVDFIYLSGISLAILNKQDRDTLLTQLKNYAKKGIKIIFDSNYRPSLWENREEAQKCYQLLLPYLYIALVTQEDEQLLWQDNHREQIKKRLQQYGLPHLVIKAGKEGAYYFSLNQNEQHIKTQVVENIIDTTSAGDAFNAGFIAGYLQNKSINACCQQGNLLASIVIQHKGAIIPKSATSHLATIFKSIK